MIQTYIKKNKWVTIFLAITAFIIIFSSILRILTPDSSVSRTALIDSNFDNTQSEFSNITVTFESTLTIPSSLPVFTVFIENIYPRILSSLATNFNLQPHPTSNSVLQGDEYSLVIDENKNKLILSINEAPFDQEISLIDTQKVIKKTNHFIQDLFSNFSVIPMINYIQYFDSSSKLYESVPEEYGRIAIIPFNYSFLDHPIRIPVTLEKPVRVTATNETIMRVEIYPLLFTTNTKTEMRVLSQEEVQQNIDNNIGQVLSAINNEVVAIDLSSLKNGTVTYAGIEYHYSPETTQLIPYYILEGTLFDALGNQVFSHIITPAVPVRSST